MSVVKDFVNLYYKSNWYYPFGSYDSLKSGTVGGSRYFTCKTSFRMSGGGGQKYSNGRGRNKHSRFMGFIQLKKCTDITIMV